MPAHGLQDKRYLSSMTKKCKQKASFENKCLCFPFKKLLKLMLQTQVRGAWSPVLPRVFSSRDKSKQLLFFLSFLIFLMELAQDHMTETTSGWFCLFLVCSFALFLNQSGFESKALNKSDPDVHSLFSKAILICITRPNKNNCPKRSNAQQSRLFSEKEQR